MVRLILRSDVQYIYFFLLHYAFHSCCILYSKATYSPENTVCSNDLIGEWQWMPPRFTLLWFQLRGRIDSLCRCQLLNGCFPALVWLRQATQAHNLPMKNFSGNWGSMSLVTQQKEFSRIAEKRPGTRQILLDEWAMSWLTLPKITVLHMCLAMCSHITLLKTKDINRQHCYCSITMVPVQNTGIVCCYFKDYTVTTVGEWSVIIFYL